MFWGGIRRILVFGEPDSDEWEGSGTEWEGRRGFGGKAEGGWWISNAILESWNELGLHVESETSL